MKKIKIIYYLAAVVLLLNAPLLRAQTADSLSHYLEVAGMNNQNLKSDFLMYKAALEKIPQVGTLKDPQLDFGFFLKPMRLVNGRQIASLKFMQMFPWFGTLKAAQKESAQMAQVAYEKFRTSRDNLFYQVYAQWYMLCDLKQQIYNSVENKKLLDQLHSLAVTKYSSPNLGKTYSIPAPKNSQMSSMGGGMKPSMPQPPAMMGGGGSGMGMSGGSGGLSDVLRIELEQVELGNKIETMTAELNAQKAKFNALLNRQATDPVVVPDNFEKLPFILDMASATNLINGKNPMLAMIDAEKKTYEARADRQRKEGYPTIGLGVQYLFNGRYQYEVIPDANGNYPLANNKMNGVDRIMPMISVSIPIYRSKYKAQQREDNFMRQASIEKHEATQKTLSAELYGEKQRLENADRMIALYDKQTELATTTFRLSMQEFASGKTDLSNVILVQRQLLNYQLKKSESIADFNTQVAAIKKLMSFDFTTDESYEK